DELPAEQLRAVAEVEILRQRVVLPAARRIDRLAAPDAGRPVEVEEAAAAMAGPVLEDEMGGEQDRLDPGQQGVIVIDVAPARLHHPDAVAREEVRQRPAQEILRRDEIGVEDRDEAAARRLEP